MLSFLCYQGNAQNHSAQASLWCELKFLNTPKQFGRAEEARSQLQHLVVIEKAEIQKTIILFITDYLNFD